MDAEREAIIIRTVQRGIVVSVQELVSITGASEATIRRDLTKLEKRKMIKRTRGGATIPEGMKVRQVPSKETPFAFRKGVMDEKKRLIAKCAVSLCGEDETILIDGGTTTYNMVDFLQGSSLQIITNSFPMAEALVSTPNRIILTGGILNPESLLILDPEPETLISRYYASKLFLGIGGIDESGFTNSDLQVIQSERAMLKQAREIIVLADSSKFGKRGALLLCGFDKVNTVITDSGISDEFEKLLSSHGIKVVIAN